MAQGFLTAVLGEVGFETLGIVYFSYAASSAVAQALAQSWGQRTALIIGASGYVLWHLSATLAVFGYGSWHLYVASAFLGFTAAVIWTAVGAYVTLASSPSDRGKYNGVFFSLAMSSPIAGNVVAICLVNVGGLATTVLFLVMLVMSCAAFLLFFSIKSLPARSPVLEACAVSAAAVGSSAAGGSSAVAAVAPGGMESGAIYSVEAAADSGATGAAVAGVRGSSASLWSVVAQLPDVLATWEFALIFLWTAYSGFSKSFFFGTYPTLEGQEWVAPGMFSYGVANLVCSTAFGRFADARGKRLAVGGA